MIIWPGFQAVIPASAVERQMGPRLRIDVLDEPRPGLKEKWEQDIDAPSSSEQAHDAPMHLITAPPKVSNYMQRPTITPVQKPVMGNLATPQVPAGQAKIEIYSPAEAQPTAVIVPAPNRPKVESAQSKSGDAQATKPQVDNQREVQRQVEALNKAKMKADEQAVKQKYREQQVALAKLQKLARQAKQEALTKKAQAQQGQQEALAKAAQEQQVQEREQAKKLALTLAHEKTLLQQKALEEKAQEKELQKKQALALTQEKALLKQKELEKQALIRERLGRQEALVQQAALELQHQRETQKQSVLARQVQQDAMKEQKSVALRQQEPAPKQAQEHEQQIQRTVPVSMPMDSPADRFKMAQQQAARYAELLEKWLASEKKQSLEPVLQQGQAAAAILRDSGNLNPEALQILGQQMRGYILQADRGIVATPDTAYFTPQAQLHGLPADVAFTALIRQTWNGYGPIAKASTSGMNGCTRFGSHELVRLYGAWKEFQNKYPTAYVQLLQDPNLPLLSHIEDQLLNSRSACDGPDSVQDELQAFIAGYPNSDLTPKLKKRLGHFQRKSAGMVFYQGVKHTVDSDLSNQEAKHE